MTKLVLFTPPKLELLPTLEVNHCFQEMLMPLLDAIGTMNLNLKIVWDPTDFAFGVLTPLAVAVLTGNHSLLQFVLPRSQRCLNRNIKGASPLLHAIVLEDITAAEMLLHTDGVDVNKKDILSQMAPLAFASHIGSVALVQILLAHPGIRLESEDVVGKTALDHALEMGHDEIVRILRAKGAFEAEA